MYNKMMASCVVCDAFCIDEEATNGASNASEPAVCKLKIRSVIIVNNYKLLEIHGYSGFSSYACSCNTSIVKAIVL